MQARNQLERSTYQLSNELQVVRGRVETQSSELATLTKELKSRSMKHELDNKMAVSSLFRFTHFMGLGDELIMSHGLRS